MLKFDCAFCDATYEVDDNLADTVIRCRHCDELGRVLRPKPIEREAKQEAKPSQFRADEPPVQFRPRGSVLLGWLSAILFVIAFVVHLKLDERHTWELRDRAPEYLLVALGIMTVGLAVICWAIEKKEPPPGAGNGQQADNPK
jgi:hypothetical protein